MAERPVASAESSHNGGLVDERDAGGCLLQNRRITTHVISVQTAALPSQLGIAEPTTLLPALNSPKPEVVSSALLHGQVHVYIYTCIEVCLARWAAGARSLIHSSCFVAARGRPPFPGCFPLIKTETHCHKISFIGPLTHRCRKGSVFHSLRFGV